MEIGKLYISPNNLGLQTLKDAKVDPQQGILQMPTDAPRSRSAKMYSKVKDPIPRFFESPNQAQGYWSEGEYDIVAIFKLLKTEALFFKATQKKITNCLKSGVDVHSDNDKVKEYMDNRFKMMKFQTNISLEQLIKELAYYLIVCSNAFVIKVRDKDYKFAQSYKVNNKELQPVVGLFLPHPTSIKPRFKWVKFTDNEGQKRNKLELVAWVFTNRRGIMNTFPPEDVAHFSLFKEEGMIFGTPEVIPVIDDIRTLRKVEEDIQLLIYRDLFPILHYTIENPTMIDHQQGISELDQAKRDLERMMQDGGIATDARHKIDYVGAQGKHLDAKPYLEYFQQRVLSGLGVSQTDVGIGDSISGNTAQTMSSQMIDYVKFLQGEIVEQFNRLILNELILQSPFGPEVFNNDMLPVLKFGEVDIEWKIRKENHEADLFAKGVKTIDEVRNPMGQKDFTDEHHARTHHGLYEKPQLDKSNEIAEKGLKVQAATKATQLKAKAATKTAKSTSSGKKSAATKDLTKSSGSNSNSVKSGRKKHRDAECGFSPQSSLSIKDDFIRTIQSVNDNTAGVGKKFNSKLSTKMVYNLIKGRAAEQLEKGMLDAISDLAIPRNELKTPNDILTVYSGKVSKSVDELNTSVSKHLSTDDAYLAKAANRIAMADQTEQVRAYNFGYAATCFANGVDTFETYHFDDDNQETIDTVSVSNATDLFSSIPPLHPNSKTILRVKISEPELEDEYEESFEDDQLSRDRDIALLTGKKFTREYIAKTYGYDAADLEDDETVDVIQDSAAQIAQMDPSRVELQLASMMGYIETMKLETAALKDKLDASLNRDDSAKIQEFLQTKLNSIRDSIADNADTNSRMTAKYLDSIAKIIDAVNNISKDNIDGIKAIADSIPKEFTINTAPIDVKVDNPAMELNLAVDQQKKTVKRVAKVIRDDMGRAVSMEIEETEE